MRDFQKLTSLLSILAILSASTFAASGPVDLSQRNVLLERSAEPGTTLAQTRGLTSEVRAAFQVETADIEDDTLYTVLVGFESRVSAPAVSINGRPLLSAPVPNGSSWLYRIPPLVLQAGTNEVVVDLGAKPAGDVAELQVFSLLDSFEEVHFNQVFAEPAGVPRSAPSSHPDQALIDILHYDLDVTLNMNAPSLTAAAAEITVEAVDNNVSQIVLDFHANGSNLTISSVTFEPGGVSPGSFTNTGSRLLIGFPGGTPINIGDQRTVRLVYSGTPDTSAGAFGLNVFNRTPNNGSGNPVIYTFNEPYNARYWFPCKDLPDDKATADISITCPTAYIPVSNGTLTSIDSLGGGLHRFNWSETHPMPTYLVSIVCTNFDYDASNYTSIDTSTTMEVGHYTWPGEIPNGTEATLVANTIDVLSFFADTFGEYPFLDEKYVTATWGGSFGMEHQTATSINNGNLLSVAEPGKSRRNVHELSHQWFGNQVTNVDFTHLWLQEGWATFCEALYWEYDDGTAAYFSQINTWMGSTINNTTPLVNANADAFQTSLVYRKGALVLHMLRGVMGDANFFQGARNYLANHAYGTVDTQDFEDAMEAAHGAQLDWFFDEWVYGTGRPDYDWWWEPASGSSVTVGVSQSGTFFEMPIRLHLQLSGGGEEVVTVYNDQPIQSFTVAPTSGTVVDVEFDPENWIYKTKTEITGQAPTAPTIQSVAHTGTVGVPDEVTIKWLASVGALNGYEIQVSHDVSCWVTIADSDDIGAGGTEYVFDYSSLGGCLPASILPTGLYFRIRATSNTAGSSEWTDVYGFRPRVDLSVASTEKRLLVVDAFDRSLGTNPQPHKWAASNGLSVAAYQAPYDTCANERVGVDFSLGDYEAVIWVCAEESTADESFSSAEQALVTAYLQGGGNLFVSGSEIAWDLDRNSGPSSADRAFLNNYLKADWPGSNAYDDSNDWGIAGSAGGIFASMSFAIDDGSQGIYPVLFPDYFELNGGSTSALTYSTQGGIAGLQFSGTFPGGSSPGRLVYFGFGFETIATRADRDEVMEAILTFFDFTAQVPVSTSSFMLY